MGKDRQGVEEKSYLDRGAIMGSERNLALGKFPEIHKDDPS